MFAFMARQSACTEHNSQRIPFFPTKHPKGFLVQPLAEKSDTFCHLKLYVGAKM